MGSLSLLSTASAGDKCAVSVRSASSTLYRVIYNQNTHLNPHKLTMTVKAQVSNSIFSGVTLTVLCTNRWQWTVKLMYLNLNLKTTCWIFLVMYVFFNKTISSIARCNNYFKMFVRCFLKSNVRCCNNNNKTNNKNSVHSCLLFFWTERMKHEVKKHLWTPLSAHCPP